MNQQEIDAHNTRESWVEVLRHLAAAHHELEQAQGCMDDLNVAHIADNLTPTVEAVARFRQLAADKVEA